MANGKYEYWLSEDGRTLLEGWARNGLTNEQIAYNIGITGKTLYEWKNKYSDISESLKKGKEVVDIQVENALLKRALGYRYKEITRELQDGELAVTKEVNKEMAPDTTALAIWLNNRKPEQWRRNANKERLEIERLKRDKDNDERKFF